MRLVSATLLALAATLPTCTAEEATLQDSSACPFLPSNARIGSMELFDLFEKVCLTSYPDVGETVKAMKSAGLKVVDVWGSEGAFEDTDRGIEAGFAEIIYELAPGSTGEGLPDRACMVSAEVTDRDFDWKALTQTLPDRITGEGWTYLNSHNLQFKRGKTKLVIEITPPSVALISSRSNPLCAENGCRVWSSALLQLSVIMPSSP
jgi:hypothetical protein